MTPEQFAYWLRGFVELHPGKDKEWTPTTDQWKEICGHLDKVFTNETISVEEALLTNKHRGGTLSNTPKQYCYKDVSQAGKGGIVC